MATRETILITSVCLAFLITGSLCLFYAETVRDFALKISTKGWCRFNPFLSWMKTPGYVWSLRIVGGVAFCSGLLLLWGLLRLSSRFVK